MDPRLYTFAKKGNVYHLKQLLNENPSLILVPTPHGNTAIHIAVRFGHKDIVDEIYSRKPYLLTQPNLDGDTPLHVATRAGQFAIVYFLVTEILSSFQGDIEKRGNGGIEILRLGNKENNTVLHEAVRKRHLKLVDFLLTVEPGLACSINNAGESPLYRAIREGMLEFVNRILLLGQSFAHGGSDGQTSLHAAIIEGHSDIIEALLRVRPQLIKETDSQGRIPLHYAACVGNHRTVRRLLELDIATAYTLDKDGQSPLHVAANKGHMKVIKGIIEHCPDSGELLDFNGQNALHVAILNGKVNVVRYILETTELEGLINQADTDGNTPLHLATMGEKTWIVRYLIWDGRVDRKAKNKNGEIAINIDGSISEQSTTVPKMLSIWRQLNFLRARIIREEASPSSNQEGKTATMQTYKQMGHTLLMVATLIATVTFAAAFTMPGGYNNNVGPDQGLALLRTSIHLKWFIISDSIAMTCSVNEVCIIFWGAVIAKESYVYYFANAVVLTYVALLATSVAFTTGIIAVMPNQQFIRIMSHIVGSAFHVSTCFFLYQLVQIFSMYEVYQLLCFRLCKLKSKFIKG